MSKICPYCKSEKIGSFSDTVYCCTACQRVLGKSQLIDRTVFDHITESVETLADKLVYYASVKIGREKRLGWLSTITGDRFYYLRDEAIAATVEELKKEWKG